MPEEVPALTGRTRLVAGVGVVLVVAVGLVLRFWTRSGLWLDEALTVDIARLPLHAIPEALKHDGAPPLYYYLLHFWIALFGQSNDAVRSLSGIFAVLTLPVAWLCGKRFGGRAVAWTTLALLASAPFAVYYGTEARMYALVILLTGLGFLALQRAIEAAAPGQPDRGGRRGRRAPLHPVLVALPGRRDRAVAAGLHRAHPAPAAARAARRCPPSSRSSSAAVLFVPWVPTFIYQSQHTATPWAAPPNFSAVINAVTGFTDNQGSTLARRRPTRGGCSPSSTSPCWPWPSSAWARPTASSSSTCTPGRARVAPPSSWSGTLFAAIAGGIITAQRVLVALRRRGLPAAPAPHRAGHHDAAQSQGAGWPWSAVAVVAGLVSSAQNVRPSAPRPAPSPLPSTRTPSRATSSPSAPTSSARRSTARCDDPSRYDMLTFPRRTSPAIVDWVDYAKTVHAASPSAFADYLAQQGRPAPHRLAGLAARLPDLRRSSARRSPPT